MPTSPGGLDLCRGGNWRERDGRRERGKSGVGEGGMRGRGRWECGGLISPFLNQSKINDENNGVVRIRTVTATIR